MYSFCDDECLIALFLLLIEKCLILINEYLINRFTSIVWKNSIVRPISITKIVMAAPQRAYQPLRDDVKEIPCNQELYF